MTNARLYRLQESVTDLDTIRQAVQPSDIADELEWTWYYHDSPMSLLLQNGIAIEQHRESAAELVYRFPHVAESMERFVDRPNWIPIINIRALATAARAIETALLAAPMIPTRTFLGRARQKRRR